MKITENTPTRLVLERKLNFTPLIACFALFAIVASVMMTNTNALTGEVAMISATIGLLGLAGILFALRRAARTEVIFDKPGNTLTINSHRRHGTETQTAALSDVKYVAPQSPQYSSRLAAKLEDGRALFFTTTHYQANHRRTVAKIKKWLKDAQD